VRSRLDAFEKLAALYQETWLVDRRYRKDRLPFAVLERLRRLYDLNA
jgi:hypothetical protein